MASGLDPALYTLSGHARASYSPFTTQPNRNELINVESHTSDGNDQPSSCGVHGDGAASQSSLIIDGAAAAAPQSDVTSSLACSASPRASAEYGSTLVQPYPADARVMHPDSCERDCGAAPCAPAASPHIGRALSASAAAPRMSEKSIENILPIDFSGISSSSQSASVVSGGAALSQLREAAPTLRTPHHEPLACGGFASLQPFASQAELSGNNFMDELPPSQVKPAAGVGGLASVAQLVAKFNNLETKYERLESAHLLLKASIQTSTNSQGLVSQGGASQFVSPVPFELGSASRA